MSGISVHRVAAGKVSALPVAGEIEQIFEEVSQRAFELFQRRGSLPGGDLDDWLQAERELIWSPPVELIETDLQFKLRLAASGYEPEDIQVTVLPDAIIVTGELQKETRKTAGTIHISEFTSKRLFRRVPLPSTIDIAKVIAFLDQGLLLVVAAKSQASPQTARAAAATTAGA